MSVRVKFIIVGVLLAIALCATAVAAGKTMQAVQGFQQDRTLVSTGDVRSVRPWMTVPYIARTYNVPASYLYRSLNVSSISQTDHVTLRMIAAQTHRTEADVIQSVQQAILSYRRQHPPARKTPTPAQGNSTRRVVELRRWVL